MKLAIAGMLMAGDLEDSSLQLADQMAALFVLFVVIAAKMMLIETFTW